MAGSEYESVLCVKNEIFVYQIPARQSNRGYRAADWNLDKPDWVGRMKVTSKGSDLVIRLEDKNNGELFAQCPVDIYPGIAIEQVTDSSRYFVVRIQDGSARKAFIGIGFADRGDSFDLLVAIQDHFKWVKREETQQKEEVENVAENEPKLDLGFKEGQTIRINLSTKRPGDENSPSHSDKPRPRGQAGGLLPPPGGSRIVPPPRAPAAVVAAPVLPAAPSPTPPTTGFMSQNNTQLHAGSKAPCNSGSGGSSNVDLLMNFGCSSGSTTQSQSAFQPIQPQTVSKATDTDPWGAFTSATGSSSSNQSNQSGGNWVNFE